MKYSVLLTHPHSHPSAKTLYRVTYRMTDQMGVVYYGNYMEFFEIGRAELFRSAGLNYRHMESDGFLLAATHASCDYLASAFYDDLLEITTRITTMTRAKIHFSYEIRRQNDPQILARGATHHVYLSRDGRPRRISPEWWNRLETILAGHLNSAESGAEKDNGTENGKE